jgi:hypothetical protein
MSARIVVALPASMRRRGEIAGLCTGLVALPLSFIGPLMAALPQPSGLAVMMAVLSALAASIACVFSGWLEPEDGGGFGFRTGIRAGVVASFAAGASIVLAATLHAYGLGGGNLAPPRTAISALVMPAGRPLQVLIIALMGVPPAAFFGVAGSLVSAALIGKRHLSDQPEAKPLHDYALVPVSIILVLLLGFVSPVALFFRSNEKPPANEVAPVLVPPPPQPKWRYAKPPTLASSSATEVAFADQRTLGELHPSLPVAISPDGTRFAACLGSSGGMVQVWDLDGATLLCQFAITSPSSLSWSPNSGMLLCGSATDDAQFFVIDVEQKRLLSLPQPKNERFPAGQPDWWADEEVMFLTGDKKVRLLDLDSLRVHPPEASTKWRGMSESERAAYVKSAPDRMAHTAKWRVEVEPLIQRYRVPITPSQPREASGFVALGIVSSELQYAALQPAADIVPGDRLIAAADASKIIRIRGSNATVFYLGLRGESELGIKVSMPGPPEAELASTLEKKHLCAFICAPLVNPLNGKTVGPDRHRVRALVRVARWADNEAIFWIDREFDKVREGDVVADLHEWRNHVPLPAGELSATEWFSVIKQMSSAIEPAPRSDAAALDRKLTIKIDQGNGADRILEIIGRRNDVPAVNAEAPKVERLPEVSPPPKADETRLTQDQEEMLRTFVEAHHAKSSRGDVSGLVEDYADRVIYMSHGTVGRQFILKDIGTYHRSSLKITESIIGDPKFQLEPSGIVRAVYLIRSFRKTNTAEFRRVAEMDLRIRYANGGLEIVEQHIRLRQQENTP